MKLILSHPTSNTFSRALALELLRKKMLFEFYTTVACFEGSVIYNFGFLSFLKEFRRRVFVKELEPYIRTQEFWELGRMFSGRLKLEMLKKHEKGIFSVENVYKQLDLKLANNLSALKLSGVNAVYNYEDGAFETFSEAKKLGGIKCIYDLPIAYWSFGRKLMLEEADRLPNWKGTLIGGITDSKEKTDRKTVEYLLADTVVVPSKFVADSLPVGIKKNIILSPFGTPISNFNNSYDKNDNKKPLRVLFVGSMGQRKGLGDLFAAVKLLNTPHIELVVLGSMLEQKSFYTNELSDFTYEPGRPHHEVLNLMRTCDVFCLPSIVEGRALVMQEAMSQGLPLIITPNTGGEDLIIEGKTGFLVPIRSPHQIAEKLDWCLNHRDELVEMGILAKNHAAHYTWQQYADTIIKEFK